MLGYCLVLALSISCYFVPGIDSQATYRKDGQFIIGAILPLTTGPKCGQVDEKGASLAEAIAYGVEQIRTESAFKVLKAKQSVGYDIRDNCGKSDTTRKHAHDISVEALAYKKAGSTGKKPPDVVIAAFENKDISSLAALDGAEILAAVSYSSKNARLDKTEANKYKIGKLISSYPEEGKKMVAVSQLVTKLGFKYVHGITDDSDVGKAALGELEKTLSANDVCMSSLYGSVDAIVEKVKKNPLIKVLVVHTSEEKELALYKRLANQSISDVTIITTRGFNEDIASLQAVKEVVDGGLDIYYKRSGKIFDDYMKALPLPYTGRKWLQALFKQNGGSAACLKAGFTKTEACSAAEAKVRQALIKNSPDSEYAYHAVLSIGYALQKTLESGKTLLEQMRGLKIAIKVLSAENVVYNQDLTATITNFVFNNLRINDADQLEAEYVGWWDKLNEVKQFSLTKSQIEWSGGAEEAPKSVCSAQCSPGFKRVFESTANKCCWDCTKCANGTVSNVTDAVSCHKCEAGTVIQPKQDGCKKPALLYFEWFGGPGAVVIVLMVIGVALVLFGLGVFSRNSQHELVIYSNYNSLCLFLLAILILIFAPVPLLVKIPTISSCSAYILMFNLGVTIVLGIITSRSAPINNLFDGNGELTKGSLGRFPRTTVVLICVVLQVIVQIVALNMETIQTIKNDLDGTENWDKKYHECSSWSSSTFWAGFVINVVISVVGNSLSCSSLNMADNAYELKYVLLCHLMFYLWGIVELVVFFRTNDQHLAGAQAVVCILLALSFFLCYAWPKIYAILFNSKGGKLIAEEEDEEEAGDGIITEAHAMHASAGYKGAGIVSVKIRDADDD